MNTLNTAHLELTLQGEMAEWLADEAFNAFRTPQQQLEHMLSVVANRKAVAKLRNAERKRNRQAWQARLNAAELAA